MFIVFISSGYQCRCSPQQSLPSPALPSLPGGGNYPCLAFEAGHSLRAAIRVFVCFQRHLPRAKREKRAVEGSDGCVRM